MPNLLWALLAVGAGVFAATGLGGLGVAAATPVSTTLAGQVGQQVTMNGVLVTSVPADEGFWVNSDHGRVWVQIATVSESPYDVDAGDTVSFTGQVVAHNQNFPARVGVTSAEGAADLTTAGAHVAIKVNALAFTS